METIPINSPLGYYLGMYMWCSLVAFTHATVLGTTIIAKEERNRTAEFIFTKPYPRKTIIKGKIIAAVLNVAAMTLTATIANIGMLATQAKGESILGAIGITMLAMFLIQVLFLSAGMLLAARCKSNKRALSISVLFVLTSYVLMVIIEYVGTVDFLGFLSPFLYFPGAALVEKGFNIFYILLTIIIAAVSVISRFLCIRGVICITDIEKMCNRQNVVVTEKNDIDFESVAPYLMDFKVKKV